MEAMMQLPPVVGSIVVRGPMLVFHPPTRARRHMNIYSSLVCVCNFLWSVLVQHPTMLLFLQDLAEFLEQIGFSKYLALLEEQDIDLRIFLTLTENDLKEIGIR